MKAPLSWLREYVTVDATVEEIADRLFTSALQVDEVAVVGVPDVDGNVGRFLVGRVPSTSQSTRSRPAARLPGRRRGGRRSPDRVRGVELEAGATVAVAVPGAYLPIFDQPLDERELRGQTRAG